MPVRLPDRRILRHAPLRSPVAEPSLMGMPHAAERWTADRVRALPDDGNRYELVSGKLLVTPLDSEAAEPPTQGDANITLQGLPAVLSRQGSRIE